MRKLVRTGRIVALFLIFAIVILIYVAKIISYMEINQLEPPVQSEIGINFRRLNLLIYKQNDKWKIYHRIRKVWMSNAGKEGIRGKYI